MKYLLCFTLIFLMGCNLYDLGADKERTPGIKRDKDGAVTEFDFPDIKDLGLDEVRKNRKNCASYKNHTLKNHILEDKALFNSIVNCMAYSIDKGLDPICEAELQAKEELERSNSEAYTEAIEDYLDVLEEQKGDFIDDIRVLSDEFFELCEGDLAGWIDEEIDKSNSSLKRAILKGFDNIAVTGDCRRVYRAMDSKVNGPCSGINFDALYKKK